MRRLGAVVSTGLAFWMAHAAPALAGSEIPRPQPGEGSVSGLTVTRGVERLAFTGANISLWMVIVGALLVLGVVFLLLGRRRAAASR